MTHICDIVLDPSPSLPQIKFPGVMEKASTSTFPVRVLTLPPSRARYSFVGFAEAFPLRGPWSFLSQDAERPPVEGSRVQSGVWVSFPCPFHGSESCRCLSTLPTDISCVISTVGIRVFLSDFFFSSLSFCCFLQYAQPKAEISAPHYGRSLFPHLVCHCEV